MTDADIWIDVVCRGSGRNETVCTLFARQVFASPPRPDESLSFNQQSGSSLYFSLMTAVGPVRSCGVTVGVDAVSQYDKESKAGVEINLSIRCSPIYVVAEQDARIVCDFMIQQLGFEIDPYAINKLGEWT